MAQHLNSEDSERAWAGPGAPGPGQSRPPRFAARRRQALTDTELLLSGPCRSGSWHWHVFQTLAAPQMLDTPTPNRSGLRARLVGHGGSGIRQQNITKPRQMFSSGTLPESPLLPVTSTGSDYSCRPKQRQVKQSYVPKERQSSTRDLHIETEQAGRQ